MKFIASVLLAATVFSGVQAEAQWGRGRGGYDRGRGGYDRPRRDYPRYPRRGGRDTVVVGAACAPEVLEGNVKATDRTLTDLAKSSEFASASTFKSEVSRIAAMKDVNAKTAAYFDMVGVDAADSKQIVEFVGAREVSNAQLAELQHSADLSAEQATVVAKSLQQALKGGLQ